MKKSKLNSLTKGLFSDKSKAEDVLREHPSNPGKLMRGSKVLSVMERNSLIEQAKFLQNQDLMSILLNEMKYLCEKKIYEDSKDQFDVAVGKMGLWYVDVMKKKIAKLAGLPTN